MADYNLIRIEELDNNSALNGNDFLIITELNQSEYKTTKVSLTSLLNKVNTGNVKLQSIIELSDKLRESGITFENIESQTNLNTLVVAGIAKINQQSLVQSDWTESDTTTTSHILNKPFVPNYLDELFDVSVDGATEGQLLVKRGDQWIAQNLIDVPEVIRFQGFVDTLTEDAPESQPGDMFIQHREDGINVIPNVSWNGLLEYEVGEGQYIVYSTNNLWNLGGGSVDPQKQSDWAQRNSLDADFIKNKPYIPKVLDDLLDVVEPQLANDGDVLVKSGENWYPAARVTPAYVDDKDQSFYDITKEEYTSLVDIRTTQLTQQDQTNFNLLESKLDTTEEVLRELVDTEVTNLTEYINVNDANIREVAQFNFNFLDNLIRDEISGRESSVVSLEIADQNLSNAIDAEKVFRIEEDIRIEEYVDAQDAVISQRLIEEIAERRSEANDDRLYTRQEVSRLDQKIETNITELTEYLDAQDAAISQRLITEISDRRTEANDDRIATSEEVSRLDTKIETNISELTEYVNVQDNLLGNRIIKEISDRRDEVNDLRIFTNSEFRRLDARIDAEVIELTNYVDTRDSNLNQKIEEEKGYRIDEDKRITDELTKYIDDQDIAISNRLIEEVSDRRTEVNELRNYTKGEIERVEELVDTTASELKTEIVNYVDTSYSVLESNIEKEKQFRIQEDERIVTELTENLTEYIDTQDNIILNDLILTKQELRTTDITNRRHTDEEVNRLEVLIGQQTGGLRYKGTFGPGNPLPDLSDHINGDYFMCSEDEYTDSQLDEECNSGDIAIVSGGRYQKVYRANYDDLYIRRDGELIQTIDGRLEVSQFTNDLDGDNTLTTKSYVDFKSNNISEELETLDSKTVKLSGNNYIDEEKTWRLKTEDKTYVSIVPEDNKLGLYHVRDPESEEHGVNKRYVDSMVGDVTFQVFGIRDISGPIVGTLPVVIDKLVELGQGKADLEYVDIELDKLQNSKADLEYVDAKIGDIDYSDLALKSDVEEEVERLESLIENSGAGESTVHYEPIAPLNTDEDPLNVGDVWVDSVSLIQFVWTGTEWVEIGAAGETGDGAQVFFQEQEPDSDVYPLGGGELWVNSSTMKLYVYNNLQWTEVNYIDKKYVDEEIGKIDLSPFATFEYVDEEIGKIDLEPFATSEYVDEEIGNIDLSPFATTEYVDDAISVVLNKKPIIGRRTTWTGKPESNVTRTLPARVSASGNPHPYISGYGAFFPFAFIRTLHTGPLFAFVLNPNNATITDRTDAGDVKVALGTHEDNNGNKVEGVTIWSPTKSSSDDRTFAFEGVLVEADYDYTF